MIDIIKDHVRTDFTFWNGASIGNPDHFFKQLIIQGASNDFASSWAKNGAKYEQALKLLVTMYKKA